jgi:hypothetical protein
LQSRGKGTKHKKKYKGSTGGSLSDSSGSVIRQVGALIDFPSLLSQNFIPKKIHVPLCIYVNISPSSYIVGPSSSNPKGLPPNAVTKRKEYQ